MNDTLYIVIPCYNEQEALPFSAPKILDKLSRMMDQGAVSEQSRVLFVDDGSKDHTWKIVQALHKKEPLACGLRLSRNRGHQNALIAGLNAAKDRCDFTITIDADLQDDIEVMDQFVEKYKAGCQVVYGVRNARKKDSFLKRSTAQFFYKLMKILGADVVYNHADYRLLSRRVMEELFTYEEVNLFLRGLIPLIGFQSDVVYYERFERVAGKSKYPLKKMLFFALDGVTSFSVKPLKIIANLGIIIAILSALGLIYAIVSKLVGVAVAGWTAIVTSIWLLGGIQLFCLGIIGEYIGKVYSEVKHRPKYAVEQLLMK